MQTLVAGDRSIRKLSGALSGGNKVAHLFDEFRPFQPGHPLDDGAAHHHPVHVRGQPRPPAPGWRCRSPLPGGISPGCGLPAAPPARSGGSSVPGPGDPGHRNVVEKPLGEAAHGSDALRRRWWARPGRSWPPPALAAATRQGPASSGGRSGMMKPSTPRAAASCGGALQAVLQDGIVVSH